MSRIPFLDNLGDEFESAIESRQPRPRFNAVTVAALAFALVLAAGAGLWLLRDGRDPNIAEPASTTTTLPPEDAAERPTIPDSWARIPAQTALGGVERTTLSSVTATPSGFVAVGTTGLDSIGGVIVESVDGVEWSVLAELDDVSVHDVAYGPAGLVATGMRNFLPVVVREDGSVVDLPVLAGSGERAINAFAVTATDSGFVVAGVEQVFVDEQSERPAAWWSEDGTSWRAVDSPTFAWTNASGIQDLVVNEGIVVAVGLVGEEPGSTIPVAWVSTDGGNWEQHEMPAPADIGFTGASGVSHGHDRYVAVGFSPSSSGRAGAAWVSDDGRTWEVVADEDLAGVDGTETWIHSVALVADGFVAVGHSFERPGSRHVIWTSDKTGSNWERLDLDDPGEVGATWATDVAVAADMALVVGSVFDITYTEASGAVWIGPAPASLQASGPVETTATTEPTPDSATLSIDPERAVSATSVRVVGRLPEQLVDDEIVVVLRAEDGTTIEFCRAVRQARNFLCRARLGELDPPPDPGTYRVVAPAVGDIAEPTVLEVAAEGSQIVNLTGVYTPTYGPLLRTLIVQNKGGEPVDLAGWAIVNKDRDDPRFVFPTGALLQPAKSALVDFSGSWGAICPDDEGSRFYWCNVVGDSDRIDYRDEEMLWKGGLLQLLDDGGNVVAEWQPGSQ